MLSTYMGIDINILDAVNNDSNIRSGELLIHYVHLTVIDFFSPESLLASIVSILCKRKFTDIYLNIF